jgi:hypothetical protein
LNVFLSQDNFDEDRQMKYSSIRAKYGMKDPNEPNPFALCSKYSFYLNKTLEKAF